MAERSPADVGAVRVLAVAYAFFVLAAGARSAVQIATKFDQAPFAYALSAASAAVYAVGLVTFVLAERRPSRRRYAVWVCTTELAGVVAVGLASVLVPSAFPDATVWSGFGSGYAFVPLVLPLLGLAWAVAGAAHRADPRPSPP